MTAAPRRELSRSDVALLCAWLLVMNAQTRATDRRFLVALALRDFGAHPCIDCLPCNGSDLPMSITAAQAHWRDVAAAHVLSVNQSTLEVI